jgi:hypothetical protein
VLSILSQLLPAFTARSTAPSGISPLSILSQLLPLERAAEIFDVKPEGFQFFLSCYLFEQRQSRDGLPYSFNSFSVATPYPMQIEPVAKYIVFQFFLSCYPKWAARWGPKYETVKTFNSFSVATRVEDARAAARVGERFQFFLSCYQRIYAFRVYGLRVSPFNSFSVAT